MDLGLGGFLEKFEEHFGRGWTKALLVLLGLTVATVCGSILWTWFLRPVLETLPNPGSRKAIAVGKLIIYSGLLLWGLNIGFQFANNVLKRRLNKQLMERLKAAKALEAEGRANLSEARGIIATTERGLQQMFDYAQEHKMLTQNQILELSRERRRARPYRKPNDGQAE